MKIIPFEPEHALLLPVRDIEQNIKDHEDFITWVKENDTPGTSYSCFDGDKLIGCGGIRILWKGVGEGWVLFSPDVVNYKKSIYKVVSRYLKKIIEAQDLHRVQAHVRCDWPIAFNFVKNLGFEIEGKKRKFNPDGTDSFLYALVR